MTARATGEGSRALLVRRARRVPLGTRADGELVDLLIAGGTVTACAPDLPTDGVDDVIDADGRWVMPGLWDAHTHPIMWALTAERVDLVGTTDAPDAVRRVREYLESTPSREGLVFGYGYRSAAWPTPPTVAVLDAATGSTPVVLASGDGHNGWLNTSALRLLGLADRDGPLAEEQWFEVYPRLDDFDPGSRDPRPALQAAVRAAHARGVVGLVDFEFGSSFRTWPAWVASGLDTIRVRAAAYPDALGEVRERGLRTGMPLVPGHDLVTMGPMKVISDGSLNTLTAWCCDPYLGPADGVGTFGAPNYAREDLVLLMAEAKALGLQAAIHAIGDAAVATALDAFEATGQNGSIEHAQLVAWADVPRMARAGVIASVQPAHLLDDRGVSEQWWADRTERLFAFAAMAAAGVRLALGSDAPVSPLDPWLAMSAAVHRSGDQAGAWHPEQSLTVQQALAASVDGQGTLGVGSRGDLVLLETDPLTDHEDPREMAAALRAMVVAATVVDGRIVHSVL